MAEKLPFQILISAEADTTAIEREDAALRKLSEEQKKNAAALQEVFTNQQAKARQAAIEMEARARDEQRQQRERESALAAENARKERALALEREQEAALKAVNEQNEELLRLLTEKQRIEALDRSVSKLKGINTQDKPKPEKVKLYDTGLDAVMAAFAKTSGEYAALQEKQEGVKKGMLDLHGVATLLSSGSLTGLIGSVGALGAAVFGAKKAFDVLITSNKDTAQAWDDLKAAAGGALTDAVNAAMGNGEALTGFLNGLTELLGGTTQKQRELNGAMDGFVKVGEKVLSQSEKLAKVYENQGRALDDLNTSLKAYADLEDAQIERERRLEDAARKRQRQEIEANADLSPEDKQARLKQMDEEDKLIQQTRGREDLNTGRTRDERELKAAELDYQGKQRAANEQAKRVKQINDYEAAKLKADQLAAQAKEAAMRAQEAKTGGGEELTNEEVADQAAKDAEAKQLAEQAKAAKQAQDAARKSLPQGYKSGDAKQAEAEQAARDKAKEEAEKALRKLDQAKQKNQDNEAKREADQQKIDDAEQQDQQQQEADRQKREQERQDAQTQRQMEADDNKAIADATKALREAGKSGNREAITKAQAELNRTKAAKAAREANTGDQADDEWDGIDYLPDGTAVIIDGSGKAVPVKGARHRDPAGDPTAPDGRPLSKEERRRRMRHNDEGQALRSGPGGASFAGGQMAAARAPEGGGTSTTRQLTTGVKPPPVPTLSGNGGRRELFSKSVTTGDGSGGDGKHEERRYWTATDKPGSGLPPMASAPTAGASLASLQKQITDQTNLLGAVVQHTAQAHTAAAGAVTSQFQAMRQATQAIMETSKALKNSLRFQSRMTTGEDL